MKQMYYNLAQNPYHKCMSCAVPFEKQDYIWAQQEPKDISYLENMLFKYPDKDVNAQFLPIQSNAKVLDCDLVSDKLLDVISPFVKSYDGVEFIPVRLMNHQQEIRPYYIMHFTRSEDVIDYEHSKMLNGTVMVPVLKSKLVKELNLFAINAVKSTIISRELRLAIIKAGQKESLMFDKVRLDTDIVE